MSPVDNRPHSVVLAAGGTAGHLEPAMATAAALLDRAAPPQVTFLGTPKGLEGTLVPARGYALRTVPAVTLPRGSALAWVDLAPRLVAATRAARRVLASVRCDVVVGFGGYASLPAYLAARRDRVPIVVHEANATPGVANRIGARLTTFVAVATSGTALSHGLEVGIPLRPQIAHLDRTAVRAEALRHFGLESQVPTLLVFGGSQGARRINEAVAASLPDLLASGAQVLHAYGPQQPPMTTATQDGGRYVAVAYLERMDLAYAAADLALCRSGALTCAELAAVGLPAVFVPYPFSNQEQTLNAGPMVGRGGAVLVDDERLTGQWIRESLLPLLHDPARLERMTSAAYAPASANATHALVAMIDAAARSRS